MSKKQINRSIPSTCKIRKYGNKLARHFIPWAQEVSSDSCSPHCGDSLLNDKATAPRVTSCDGWARRKHSTNTITPFSLACQHTPMARYALSVVYLPESRCQHTPQALRKQESPVCLEGIMERTTHCLQF